jgi:hypothetical protein
MLPEKTGAWIAQSVPQQCRRATGSDRQRRNALPQSLRPRPIVFATLVCHRRLSEKHLRGLAQDKLDAIRQMAGAE